MWLSSSPCNVQRLLSKIPTFWPTKDIPKRYVNTTLITYLVQKTKTQHLGAFCFCIKYCFLNQSIVSFPLPFDQVLQNIFTRKITQCDRPRLEIESTAYLFQEKKVPSLTCTLYLGIAHVCILSFLRVFLSKMNVRP